VIVAVTSSRGLSLAGPNGSLEVELKPPYLPPSLVGGDQVDWSLRGRGERSTYSSFLAF